MLAFAIDNPSPATIILISGDRGFVYAMSVLRLRRYYVIVMAPNSAHSSLLSQASAIVDWQVDILGKEKSVPKELNSSEGIVNSKPKCAVDSTPDIMMQHLSASVSFGDATLGQENGATACPMFQVIREGQKGV